MYTMYSIHMYMYTVCVAAKRHIYDLLYSITYCDLLLLSSPSLFPSLPPSFPPSFPPSLSKTRTQMLSLSLLEVILSADTQAHWLRFMVSKGYLSKLCASLQWEDEGLQKTLSPQPEALKALYIYLSKMVWPRVFFFFVLVVIYSLNSLENVF